MKETLQLILVLTLICLIAGVALAGVYGITKDRIGGALKQEMLEALQEVLPVCDNKPIDDQKVVSEGDKEWVFYVARNKDSFAGVAFETVSNDGYGGEIKVMVGVDADDNVQSIEILKQTETPGLGAKIEGSDFRDQFKGKNLVDTKWCAVAKDGGDVVAITGATISSRAVSGALKEGLEVYKKNKETIIGGK